MYDCENPVISFIKVHLHSQNFCVALQLKCILSFIFSYHLRFISGNSFTYILAMQNDLFIFWAVTERYV